MKRNKQFGILMSTVLALGLGTAAVTDASTLPSDVSSWMASTYAEVSSHHLLWPFSNGKMRLNDPLTRYQAMFAFAKEQEQIDALQKQVGDLQQQMVAIPSHMDDAVITVAANTIASTGQITATMADGSQKTGSGFFVLDNEHILTDLHVVASGTDIGSTSAGTPATKIQFALGKNSFSAQIVKTDPINDLALLQLSSTATGVSPLTFQDKVTIGQTVLVVGSPFGFYDSVNKGIVSQNLTFNAMPYIQVDAGVNEGDSGGPVVDLNGNVIGVIDFKWNYASGLSDNIAEATPAAAIETMLKQGQS